MEGTPDTISKEFVPGPNFREEYSAWFYDFRRKMQEKHGEELVSVSIVGNDIYVPEHLYVVVLTADLRS